MQQSYSTIYLFIFILLISTSTIFCQSNQFIVILDAGHGGKDPGNSYHGFVEKKIALQTALKLEKYLQKEKNIKIVHTRKSDVFIELVDRPKKANSMHANLFISIHCNSVANAVPSGTETFVMGLSRSKGNLEIAKQENSVILLEKNYKKTYKGFDPKNPETLIGLKMMQEDYLDRSIQLASKIEGNFKNKVKRKSRGIKQSPLWVLDAAYMPSVLIELGFLSNKKEGMFLNSDSGQDAMAKAIASAIIDYKKEYFDSNTLKYNGKAGSQKDLDSDVENITAKGKATGNQLAKSVNKKSDKADVIFKIQFAAGTSNIPLKSSNFKGLDNVSMRTNNNKFFKYSYGQNSNYDQAKKDLQIVRSKGYTGAYIIAFKNGKNISLQEAMK